MEISYILTGGNLGHRFENLRRAADLIDTKCGRILRRSSLFETAAWGIEAQPDFLNQVLELDTALKPEALLDVLLGIEREMGRIRGEKFGPRTIDLDILFYGDMIIRTDELEIPHPRMAERRFVLEPLFELLRDRKHPITGQTIREMLLACTDPLDVRRIIA
jgi:2-amino-4-hydroxy-6-hydroxymethyldihydropteridine diphosphokinase